MPRARGMARICFAAFAGALCIVAPVARGQSFAVDSAPCSARVERPVPTARDSTSGRSTVADSSRPRAAVVLFAAASAREVTFNSAPEVRVRLCGGMDSLHVVERRNLPDPVVVGHTYRDVYVAVEIFGRVNADCIVASLTGAPRDSTGQRNACASLAIGTAGARRPEP